jgi:hypothetical protein
VASTSLHNGLLPAISSGYQTRSDGLAYANLAFHWYSKEPDKIAGLEERGRPKMDGSGSYKGKAEGSNSSGAYG